MIQAPKTHANRQCLLVGLLLALTCWTTACHADAGRDWTLRAVAELCPQKDFTGLALQSNLPGSWLLTEDHWPEAQTPLRSTIRMALPNTDEIEMERRAVDGQLRQFRTAYFDRSGRPLLQSISDGSCTIRSGRAIRQGDAPWVFLDHVEDDLTTLRWRETLQAPWPEGKDPGGVRVGLIDSGLAYDLPLFVARLARDPNGQPLGYDFWDLDPWPYDADLSRGAFFPIRHGTTVASVLATEAPEAALVPYRYPRPDMTRMGDIVTRAARDGIRVLAMPLGSNRQKDWDSFAKALSRHDMLAIVSAGNDGRDIDQRPVYPAALDLERMIVVTSSDAFGRLAEGSNWGLQSVDIMVPAENLPVIDFRAASGRASGSSYAVPRVAALAARILAGKPALSAQALKAEILSHARIAPGAGRGVTAHGWIADPLAD